MSYKVKIPEKWYNKMIIYNIGNEIERNKVKTHDKWCNDI